MSEREVRADRAGKVLLLEAEQNRAFRSMARTITGHLAEGQLGPRLCVEQAGESLGSVVLEGIAADPDRRPVAEEAAWQEAWRERGLAAVVAFDPVAGLLGRRLGAAIGHDLPLLAVVGSLWLDPLWRHAAPSRVVVPDTRIGAQWVDWGMPPEAVVPVGLGVCGRFGEGVRQGRQACRLTQGLPPDAPALLLVTEGLWADEAVAWVEAAARPGVTLLVDAAGDRLARQAAEAALGGRSVVGRVFGRVDEAGLLWGAADRVVGVGLDHLVTRALTYRTPFWAVHPADDRQRGIAAALQTLGAGDVVDRPETLAARLAEGSRWTAPLDAGRLETVASPAVLPRVAETLTQMVLSLT